MRLLILMGILAFSFSACKTSARKQKKAAKIEKSLNGNWVLNYMTLEDDLISFEELYAEKKPSIEFNVKEKTCAGNTSCNIFNGSFQLEGNNISFQQSMAMTRMMCEGQGEEKFMKLLQKVDTYSVSETQVLALMHGNVAVLRFVRK